MKIDNYLKSILENNSLTQLYIGKNSPNPKIKAIKIDHKTLFRLPSSYHQKYQIIWAIEDDFAFHINWQQELDEMVRLITEEGKLIIKCSHSLTHNMISVKNFLGRRMGLEVSIEFEIPLRAQKIYANEKWLDEDYKTITVFNIKRKNLEIYQNKLWTFAVLTLGEKVEDVEKFCASIRNLDKKNQHQILIQGAKNSKYDKYKVDYVPKIREYRDKYSDICSKKNDVIDCAKNQNLLICHDRYYLSDNFFTGFAKYGYDFDFLSTEITYEENNNWFPSYVKMSNFTNDFEWNRERYCFKYQDFAKNNILENIFINGGLIISKKDIIKKIKFNECLFHHQIEDVEISKQFNKYKLPARANLLSKVFTTKIIEEKAKYSNKYISVGGKIIQKKRPNLYKKINRAILKSVYVIISNKKLINFLEKRIF